MTTKISKQETFDTVVAHLRKQGCKATIATKYGMQCKYRLEKDGVLLKCAAGCLIPDEIYNNGIEGIGIAALYDNIAPTSPSAIIRKQGHDLSLVSSLQTIHDQIQIDEWESKFFDIADRHNLVYTPPTIDILTII